VYFGGYENSRLFVFCFVWAESAATRSGRKKFLCMIIAPYCCCGAPPRNDWKWFEIDAPYSGFNPYTGSGYPATRYLREIFTRTGLTGTQTTTKNRDEDSNAESSSTETSGDFVWYGDFTLHSTETTETTITKTYRRWSFETSSYEYQYENFALSIPFTFVSFCTLWKSRAEEICPLSDMRESVAITAIYSGSTESTLNLVFETEYYHLTQTEIDAENVRSRIYLRPTSTYPWDEKYDGFEFDGRIYSGTDRNTVPIAFGSTGTPGGFTSGSASIAAFARTCHAFKDGFGCDAPGDFRFHDIPLQTFSLASSSLSSNTFLTTELAPGYYSFDGERLIVHSGNRISPSSNNWFDNTGGTSHHGYIAAMQSSGDDPCPP
jgi:hypothetical protein